MPLAIGQRGGGGTQMNYELTMTEGEMEEREGFEKDSGQISYHHSHKHVIHPVCIIHTCTMNNCCNGHTT